jgi:hypothetical protein
MTVWQVDFYRRPLQDKSGNPLWELLICDADGNAIAQTFCPQSKATADWLTLEIAALAEQNPPDRIQAFRPQSVNLLETATRNLGIPLEPTRHTTALKCLLDQRAIDYKTLPGYTQQPYEPVKLEQPAPVPLPENLWGQQWCFGAIAATDLLLAFGDRPIPIRHLTEELLPFNLQLASTTPIPGVIIDGGRQSMRLARWLEQSRPAALNYIPGDPDGLILEAGLVDRWVLTTFTDTEVAAAGRTFQQRQQAAKGLHFLLVQPDDSGVTYSGIWLLHR